MTSSVALSCVCVFLKKISVLNPYWALFYFHFNVLLDFSRFHSRVFRSNVCILQKAMWAIGVICMIPSCRCHFHHLQLCSPFCTVQFCCSQMSEHTELLVSTILPPYPSIVFFTFFLPHPVVLLLTILSYKTYQQHCFLFSGVLCSFHQTHLPEY